MSISQIDIVVRDNINKMREIPPRQWELVINIDNIRIKAHAVAAISMTEDYLDDAFGAYTVTAMFQPSELTNVIFPGSNRLEGTLLAKDQLGIVRLTYKYRLVMTDNQDPRVANNDSRSSDIRELNNISMVAVSFQMIDHASFDLRLAQHGDMYQDMTTLDVLVSVLSQHQLKNEYGQADAVAGFDITNGYIEEKKYITIKDGTYVKGVSDYLQERYGVYAQGCSCFLKDKIWYIFPPYGVASEGDKTKNFRLVVINAPPNKYADIRKNYRLEGTTATIIASGNASHTNTSDSDALNGATGVMYAKAGTLLGGTSRKDAGVMSGAENYMKEYGTSEYRGKEKNIVVPQQAFVSNDAKMMTALAAKAGDIVKVVWRHGDIRKLRPGCAVTFITQDERRLKTFYGTLLTAESFSSIPEGGIVERMHSDNVTLTLFLKRQPG